MAPGRRGSALMEFPSELDILITREFHAPVAVVFDVLTKPEHVSKWGATPPDRMTECSIDLRVGGSYHYSFVAGDGTVCAFRGTYLEVEPPTRTVETWLFRDKAGRDHYPASGPEPRELTSSDGPGASFDAIGEILRSLLGPTGAVAE